MGAPVETGLENFEEAILKLSVADRVKLIHWISETVVEESNLEDPKEDEAKLDWPPANIRFAEDKSGKTPWYEGVDPPGPHLTEENWKERVNSVSGLWSDLPEDFGDDIVRSRMVSTREINLDD